MAFTVHEKFLKCDTVDGLPVVPFESVNERFPPEKFGMFVAIGYTEMNKRRERIFNEAKQKGYNLLSYVHPSCTVWDDLELGENCFVFEENVIQPSVKLGDDVIIWSNNVISHHCTIGDHSFVVSAVAMAGHVTVGSNCFIGMNATIRNSVCIGKECVIGAGAVILQDTGECEVYACKPTEKLDISSLDLKEL